MGSIFIRLPSLQGALFGVLQDAYTWRRALERSRSNLEPYLEGQPSILAPNVRNRIDSSAITANVDSDGPRSLLGLRAILEGTPGDRSVEVVRYAGSLHVSLGDSSPFPQILTSDPGRYPPAWRHGKWCRLKRFVLRKPRSGFYSRGGSIPPSSISVPSMRLPPLIDKLLTSPTAPVKLSSTRERMVRFAEVCHACSLRFLMSRQSHRFCSLTAIHTRYGIRAPPTPHTANAFCIIIRGH